MQACLVLVGCMWCLDLVVTGDGANNVFMIDFLAAELKAGVTLVQSTIFA